MSKRLKNLSALVDFECAARWSSFRLAGLELHKTPAAVSQQIKQLERTLGFDLFVRHPRRVTLTDKGQELAGTVSQTLQALESRIEALRSQPEEAIIRVSTTHSLAMKWLVPRLHRFTEEHPEFDIRVESSDEIASLDDGSCDLAIRYSRIGKALDSEILMRDHLVVVYSPELVETRNGGAGPTLSDLLAYPLLYEGSTARWLRLLTANGAPASRADFSGRYSHAGLLVQAAVGGLGVALASFSLAYEDIARGRLIICPGKQLAPEYGYRVLVDETKEASRKLKCFTGWLKREAETMAAAFMSLA